MRNSLIGLLDATLGYIFHSYAQLYLKYISLVDETVVESVMKEHGKHFEAFVLRKISGIYFVVCTGGICSRFSLYTFLVRYYLFICILYARYLAFAYVFFFFFFISLLLMCFELIV